MRRLRITALIAVWLGLMLCVDAAAVERAQLGVIVTDLVAEDLRALAGDYRGSYVISVQPATPAATVGISMGDLIIALDGRATPNTHDLVCQILAHQPGDRVELTIVRSKHPMTLATTLARWVIDETDPVSLPDCGKDQISALPAE
jgi:S1-C subfamily serine protease